jgi:hypothetical protein
LFLAVCASALAASSAAFLACRPTSVVPPPIVVDVGDGAARVSSDAGASARAVAADAIAPAKKEDVSAVTFVADGAMLVELHSRLVLVRADGTRVERALAPHSVVTVEQGGRTIVVSQDDDVSMLAVPTLKEIFRGRGRSLITSDFLVETSGDDDVAVVYVQAGASAPSRLAIPAKAHVDGVRTTKSGRFAVVTFSEQLDGGGEVWRAHAFELATGKRTGDAVAMQSRPIMSGPQATLHDETQFAIRGDQVVVIDLATGSVLRRGSVGCARTANSIYGAGNITVAPTGDRFILTCEEDGVLFDAKTMRRVRGYKHLIPGCDNGPYLGGYFSKDGTQLILEGCGGEAHLDVATGKFKCGDDDGLMGASYPITAPNHPPARPPQAIGVPPCHSGTNAASSVTSLGAGYSLEWNEQGVALLGPNNLRIHLPEYARPVVAPAGDRFAYPDGTKVIVKSLPANALISTIEL